MTTTAELEKARTELHAWLEDLSALQAWTDDPKNPVRKEFTRAFEAAFARAKRAAVDYAAAVEGLG